MRQFPKFIFVSVLFLSACNVDILGSDEKTDNPVQYEMQTLQQQGGTKCPKKASERNAESLCATVSLSYPVFSATDTSNDTAINAVEAINQLISKEMLSFESEQGKTPTTIADIASLFIADFSNQPEVFLGWDLERNITVLLNNPNILTLSYSEASFTGGAHPSSGITYFVLDPKTGKQLSLADLLSSGFEGELNATGERLFRQVRNITDNALLEDEGYWFENGVFLLNNNFAVQKEGLTFQFNSYEIAPYAMGPSSVTIPYEDIANLIPKESLLTYLQATP